MKDLRTKIADSETHQGSGLSRDESLVPAIQAIGLEKSFEV